MNAKENILQGLYPSDIDDAIERWARGDIVWSVEMVGLGPGYEQAIQVAGFELLRKIKDETLPENENDLNKMLDDHLHEIDKSENLGLSGAQASAAKNLAYAFKTRGWSVMDEVEEGRHIQVQKSFP